MVAMQMRDEYVAQSVELAVRAHQLSLSALAAVNQKRFRVQTHQLCARVVAHGGFSRPASQYCNRKIVHVCKDSASREERKELTRFSFPRRSLFYEKIVQAERKEKSLLDFLSRGTPNFMRKNIFKDIVRISKMNRYFCIID